MTITLVTALVAVLIVSALWRFVSGLDDSFHALGFAIIGVFIAARAVSVIVYRLKRLDEIPASAASSR